MPKSADYFISAVQFNETNTHINKVKRHKVSDGDSFGVAEEVTRQSVITNIEGGTTYMTVFKDAEGNWKLGKQVKIITIESIKYIKTVNDGIKKDNLDNLPTF